MSNLLNEAKQIISNNRSDKAAKDFMTNAQRDALADDFAAKKQFLSASHFASDAEKRKEFERLFWENITRKNN